MVGQSVVVHGDAVLFRVRLLFLMRVWCFIPIPVVVRLGIEVRVARIVVLLALVCML
ncbi:hypothetical protein LCGC14_2642260, partial [marine sediment metagenome]